MQNRLRRDAKSKQVSPGPLLSGVGATLLAEIEIHPRDAFSTGLHSNPFNRFSPLLFTSLVLMGLLTALTGCGDSGQKAKSAGALRAEAEAATLALPRERVISVGSVPMVLEFIPKGEFAMGTSASQRVEDEAPHKVVIERAFYLAKTEVTQAQFSALLDINPAPFKGADMPVENLSWDQAAEFCTKLSDSLHETVRLPTEAEWEYACRAGTTTEYASGADEAALRNTAWYAANCQERPHAVGLLAANDWGICDMQGNVWEFCLEQHLVPVSDEKAPGQKTIKDCRIIRGGSWMDQAIDLRSASRTLVPREFTNPNVGFRIVIELKK